MSKERKIISAFELEAKIAEILIAQYYRERNHYYNDWTEEMAKVLCGKVRNDLLKTLERMKRVSPIRYWLFYIRWKKDLNFIIKKGA